MEEKKRQVISVRAIELEILRGGGQISFLFGFHFATSSKISDGIPLGFGSIKLNTPAICLFVKHGRMTAPLPRIDISNVMNV